MSDPHRPIDDLVMLVARLSRQVRKYDPTNEVAKKAMDYLKRKDLANAILRELEQPSYKD